MEKKPNYNSEPKKNTLTKFAMLQARLGGSRFIFIREKSGDDDVIVKEFAKGYEWNLSGKAVGRRAAAKQGHCET